MATRQGNKLGRSAVIEHRSAPLASEFGLRMLREKFPNEADAILARLGAISRGPRKGQPRGVITWIRVIEGGFDYGRRIVRTPGATDWDVKTGPFSEESVVQSVVRERDEAARRADAEAWDAMTERERILERAKRVRRTAARALRDEDVEDFHHYMKRARALINEARNV